MKTARIPKAFLRDHIERDLGSPNIVRETSRHFFIQIDGSYENRAEVRDLLDDADYYASEPHSFHSYLFGLCMSAKATAKAIREALA